MKTNYLTVSDLTAEQMLELKQSHLFHHLDECESMEPSWDELANADSIGPDWLIFDAYGGVAFTVDDFCCSMSV